MFAANQGKAARSMGRVRKDVGGGFLQPLVQIGHRMGPRSFFRWLRDEAQGHATMRELHRLDDHGLDDIGVKRTLDPRADDLVRRLRAGG